MLMKKGIVVLASPRAVHLRQYIDCFQENATILKYVSNEIKQELCYI